jgi:hypothetical protein
LLSSLQFQVIDFSGKGDGGGVLPPSLQRIMPWRAMGRRVESTGFALEKV